MKQQEMVKIPVHSLIDLITNSSTEIFVHSEKSVEPAKELLQELLILNGSKEKVEDVFDFSIELGRLEEYFEYYLENDEEALTELGIDPNEFDNLDWTDRGKKIKEVVKDINEGRKEIPFSIDKYHVETYLVVKSKQSKYDHLLELLNKFLYSPDWYEHSSD